MLRRIAHKLGITNTARFERAVARSQRSYPEEFRLAESVLREFHNQSELRQYTQPYKLVSLMHILQAEKPESILELGTGSSSVVFAQYATKFGKDLTCVDESEDWLENTKHMVRKFASDNGIEFLRVDKMADCSSDPPSFRYASTFDRFYDLLFIDGPSLEWNGADYKQAVCTDVFQIPADKLPRLILVDIRQPTVQAIQQTLADHFDCFVSDILLRRPRDEFRYFSVFRKKDAPARMG